MKNRNLLFFLSALFALSITKSFSQECELSCPDETITVDFTADDGYVVPDFLQNSFVSISDECEGATISQNLDVGTVLGEGEYEVEIQVNFQGEDSDCDFTLIVQQGNIGSGKCVPTCPDTLIVDADESGNYTLPNFYADNNLFFGECEFTDSTQNPVAGSINLGDTIDIFLDYSIDNVPTLCNFTLVIDNLNSINENFKLRFRMYPNPAETAVHIDSHEALESILVYDVTGKKVFQTTLDHFDVSLFEKGLYFVQVETETASGLERLIVK